MGVNGREETGNFIRLVMEPFTEEVSLYNRPNRSKGRARGRVRKSGRDVKHGVLRQEHRVALLKD